MARLRGEILFVFRRPRSRAQAESIGRAALEAVEELALLSEETRPPWWIIAEMCGLGVSALTRAPIAPVVAHLLW